VINISTGSKKLGNDFDGAAKVNRTEGKSKESFSEADKIWEKFLVLLSDTIKQVEINTWFSVISPKDFENGTLTLIVPSEDYYGMIERRYNKQIARIIESGLLGENGKLKYEVRQYGLFTTHEETPDPHDRVIKPNILALKPEKADTQAEEVKITGEREDFQSNLYPKHTFASFVKGESNELAVAAAFAITNNPGKTYNPFFVYGGVGLGKTHLIQAIGNEIVKKFPEKKVYYTTAPDFTTQFTTNIAKDRIDFSNSAGTKKLDSFYKSLDVLIIDDIQNLSGKEKTQDFMYQIFNTLFNEKKHIIFSSDKPINQIKGIEERLISRFQWGITVDIQPPNWEMRVAIIQRKLEESNISAPEEVIHYIATNVKDSIRTVEGCIVGMIAESALVYNGEINMNVAEKVIKRVIGHVARSKNISIENILYTVANYYKISENQILSRKRTKEIAFARQVAMYLAKELTNLTLESIGLNFGGKDHATVLYAYNSISEQMKKDNEIKNQVAAIREQIGNL
jgi:chromosomal replication initiator protein